MFDPVFFGKRWVDGSEPAATPFEEKDLLIDRQVVPLIGRLRDFVMDQRTVARMVGKEVKYIFTLLVRAHALIIVYLCLLYKCLGDFWLAAGLTR